MKYSKAFEKWWARTDTHVMLDGMDEWRWLQENIKRVAYRAWKAFVMRRISPDMGYRCKEYGAGVKKRWCKALRTGK